MGVMSFILPYFLCTVTAKSVLTKHKATTHCATYTKRKTVKKVAEIGKELGCKYCKSVFIGGMRRVETIN